jgi:UPF0176 protein
MIMSTHQVLLYYHYVNIENPEYVREEHLALCKSLNLLGRVFISSEGINGTVSGTVEDTLQYMKHMHQSHLFSGTDFKVDLTEGHVFKKMHVRVKNELVNFSLEDDINPKVMIGKYVEPSEFMQQLQDPDTVIIDARNDYEYDIGHFRGAIKPEIQTFRELPNWIRNHRHLLEGKKILTYCTGGVRCEKFSGWLLREGFYDVGQLHGGIVTYGKDEIAQGQLWDGQCYVFDARLIVPINRVEHVIVGKDHYTGEPCERYVNCANPECNKQIILSEASETEHWGACSFMCKHHPRNRYVERLKNADISL